MSELTHLNQHGEAHMVDVGAKPDQKRHATARGHITLAPHTLQAIAHNGMPKGDVLAVARIAGIMAAKKTADLIPLCHPIAITAVDVTLTPDTTGIVVEATVATTGKTGVEMEALTAVSVAALTIYDMCKAVDKQMTIDAIHLIEKTKSDLA
ncbi:MAG: cyclic pyranopterin monophosphate synthase MoaC [Chloroflexi bacterium]|nr:cyclic pyranopterin monophosphate synthase MoaC [Chloroflexota bacterium]